eukprot:1189738-Prorocentrum_minimum.AAC.5
MDEAACKAGRTLKKTKSFEIGGSIGRTVGGGSIGRGVTWSRHLGQHLGSSADLRVLRRPYNPCTLYTVVRLRLYPQQLLLP